MGGRGQKRPPKIATGINSAAKFVPQRSEKRVGSAVAVPGLPKTPLLERGDRTVLRTVQIERAAAQEPAEQSEGRDESCGEPQPVRCESEREWSDDRNDQENRSRPRATPSRLKRGDSDPRDRTSPRASGIARSERGATGIRPSLRVPSFPRKPSSAR